MYIKYDDVCLKIDYTVRCIEDIVSLIARPFFH